VPGQYCWTIPIKSHDTKTIIIRPNLQFSVSDKAFGIFFMYYIRSLLISPNIFSHLYVNTVLASYGWVLTPKLHLAFLRYIVLSNLDILHSDLYILHSDLYILHSDFYMLLSYMHIMLSAVCVLHNCMLWWSFADFFFRRST
jgi:hypothetical protein